MADLLDLAEVILRDASATPQDITRALAIIDLHRERRLSQSRPAETMAAEKAEKKGKGGKGKGGNAAADRAAGGDDDDRSYLD